MGVNELNVNAVVMVSLSEIWIMIFLVVALSLELDAWRTDRVFRSYLCV